MVGFLDINEKAESRYLSSVAMIFNGFLIEEYLPEYTTLTVKGRETISYVTETSGSIPGRDGEITISKNLPVRELEIKYRVKTESNETFQLAFRKLNMLLETDGEVPIQFRDEQDVTYYGQLTAMSDIPAGRNDVIGTFTILCSDPYKYESEKAATGNPIQVFAGTPYKIHPERITLLLKSSATKITVDNLTTGRSIILNGSYKSGDKIVIRIKAEKDRVTKNNQDIMREVDFMGDFYDFLIKTGDKILVTPRDAEMKLALKGRWK